MGIGELALLWFMFGRRGSSSTEPGQGGVTKQATLKGLDGRTYRLTRFGDGTALCDTDKAVFYFKAPSGPALKVMKGDSAAVADALKNLPE
jgi:hypothetical protein